MQVKEGAEEFFLEGTSNKAVLLIHGYTGTPAEMRLLGEYLQKRGFNVLGIRLPGHGTSAEELKQTTAVDWYAVAERAFKDLQARFACVMVAGLSMGGLLTLKLAKEYAVEKIALIATPIFVPDKRLPFLRILKYFVPYIAKNKKDYGEAQPYNLSYSRMPTRPLISLFRLLHQCKNALSSIKVPVLILQSKTEKTVSPKSAQYIYDHLSSKKKKLIWFNDSGHILTLDKEREQVFKAIEEFFRT